MSHIPAERCLSIVELLADGVRGMALGDIAQRLSLPKSGAHRLLATLVDLGWAEQEPETGFYRLTMRLTILGQRYYVATGIPDICQPVLDELAGRCREFARLAVVDGDSLTWLVHAQGATSGLLYQPSLATNNVPLYATASGKVWLSTLPKEEAMRVVMRKGFGDADRYGPSVIRTIDALLDELALTSRRGYGLAVNEAEPGVTAVAAAIRPSSGQAAVGTLSIAGPSARVTEKKFDELAALVSDYATKMATLWPLLPIASRSTLTTSRAPMPGLAQTSADIRRAQDQAQDAV
jgi:DNA-binding IclR family transcriptional regulator